VLLHLSGEAPYKRDQFWTATGPDGIVRIAFPQFVPKPHRIARARLSVAGQDASGMTELAEDVTAIAIQNLDDHMGRIRAKAIARSIAKLVASKGMQAGGKALSKGRSSGAQAAGAAMQVAGAVFNVGSAIAEEADKRSWITLPAAINVGKVYVAPGPFKLQVDFLDGGGNVVERADLSGEAHAGKTTFLSYRTYR